MPRKAMKPPGGCNHAPETMLRAGIVYDTGFKAQIRNRTGQDYVNDTVWVACSRCGTVIHTAALYQRLEEEKAEQDARQEAATHTYGGVTVVEYKRRDGEVFYWHVPRGGILDMAVSELFVMDELYFDSQIEAARERFGEAS